ncbi:hypothetical protein [Noviherbaspirillum sp.]|uniref:hypothetical protein n=1 Tax=Noviherbaspirillum sp. TaxID=1926288 RepID=UPI002B463226|nr:hypothetical protein [Noviherbaspirillum sp.]HJV79250.1 hypothetical protein [Noviherbaspirillum sp.]
MQYLAELPRKTESLKPVTALVAIAFTMLICSIGRSIMISRGLIKTGFGVRLL